MIWAASVCAVTIAVGVRLALGTGGAQPARRPRIGSDTDVLDVVGQLPLAGQRPPVIETSATGDGGAGASRPPSPDAILTAFTEAFVADLSDSPQYQRYLRCRDASRQPETDCARLFATAAYDLIDTRYRERIVRGDFGLGALSMMDDTSEWERTTANRLLSDSAAEDRVAALVLLENRGELQRVAIPPGYTASLGTRSIPEATLALGHVSRLSDTQDVTVLEAIGSLANANTGDQRVRGAAFEALGRPASASQLTVAVRDAVSRSHEMTLAEVAPQIGSALARCGSACLGEIQLMCADDRPPVNEIGVNAAMFLDPASASAVRSSLAASDGTSRGSSIYGRFMRAGSE